MKWEVVLHDPESILEELTKAFKANENTIVRSKVGVVLRSNRFQKLTNATDVTLTWTQREFLGYAAGENVENGWVFCAENNAVTAGVENRW